MFDTMLPGAVQVADPFHVKLGRSSPAGATRSSPGTDPTSGDGRTEAVNNLVKSVKPVAFGMRNFAHYRIRSLLDAGKPNRALLDTITPP